MPNFEIEYSGIEGLYIINSLSDITYDQSKFEIFGLNMKFVQENESLSKKGVLRGLHYQTKNSQGKLVRVVEGKIFDVAVDMRKKSKTYLKWFGIELSEDNKKQFYIPEGFAHGFYVMSEYAKVIYKVSNYWYPEYEVGIPWNDDTLNIKWPIKNKEEIIIADKDKNYIPLKRK